ncbi:hypothetical protein [Endozoicomonas sp. 4G]|uniref:hypothetical protein n=1 Tax=Endozoicomonas sp. 4G TaxID=2872754 RepID=UPI002078C07F|nr:hypothetical protein [Endozoicomonas sp. 4G]
MTLTNSADSDSLPVSIESLLHNEAKDKTKDFANGHAIASLLSDAVINHTVALIQSPDSAPASFPISQVAGKVEFATDGHSGQLSLCGEQQPDCDSHLQLTYKLFPYPHFGMTLQGQHDIQTSVDATLAQLANANRAELMLQLLEKATLHFFMASVQQKQEEVSPETAIVPSPQKFVSALQPAVKALMPEREIWKSGRLNNVLPILWGLHPSLFKSFMIEPEASSSRSLNSLKTSLDVNTAILTGKQVKLIQRLAYGGKRHEFTEDELLEVIDYLSSGNFKYYVPNAYLETPSFMKELVRNRILQAYKIPKNKLTKDMLLAHPINENSHYYSYDQIPDELKNNDFLIEFSSMNGIPVNTPPEIAVIIYGYLDIREKIKSLTKLPASFKNDDLYDELIRSGMIALKELPKHIKNKNKEYCLSQLSKGFCTLLDVPAHFMTKKSALDSINSQYWSTNFNLIFSINTYNTFTKDPDFFDELLVKAVIADLEAINKYDTSCKGVQNLIMDQLYDIASNRYSTNEVKLNSLFKKLVNANPFVLIYIESLNDKLPQDLIDIAKASFLEILKNRPELSKGFNIGILYQFFENINADKYFKSHALNIIYPYFPYQGVDKLPEEFLNKQDDFVLKSVPFDKGYEHFLSRKLRPDNPEIVIDYIERNLDFLYYFDDQEYLEQYCKDPLHRQRLIHVLAQRLIANKPWLLKYWVDALPRTLVDDTLEFLKDPALLFKLDASDKLAEPVHPFKFQSPNIPAFGLVVMLHATDLRIAHLTIARQLQLEFANAGGLAFQRVFADQHQLPLFKKAGTVVGGRTLVIPNDNEEEADYYKFQRVGEFKSTLEQEGIMHRFIAKNDRFKSKKPSFGQYLVVLEKDLPESVQGFTDPLQVTDVKGERAILVYHYKATNHYSKYAHTPDETSSAPYARPEQGLLDSIHDIGVLNGQFGIMPTSTIPAFHYTGRRWVFLSPLLGNSKYYAFPLPGKFESWIEATERPDFGWDGLRDWGDVEFYGSMVSGLTSQDSKTSGYTPEVLQRLSFANALCENLLAAVLLRSRLRRDSLDYYYKNKQAVAETENFIERLLNEYLSGLFAKEKEVQPKPRLQKLMGLGDSKYRSWLARTAQEILYWTARQPYEVTDPCASIPSGECYSKHLLLTGHLDDTLYPNPLHPMDAQKKFPRDFQRTPGRLHLGATKSGFPLTALTTGFTSIAHKVFEHSAQHTED